jgi:hypothetical protein
MRNSSRQSRSVDETHDSPTVDFPAFLRCPKKTRNPRCERVEWWIPRRRKAEREIGYHPSSGLLLGIIEVDVLLAGGHVSGLGDLLRVYMYRSSPPRKYM